MTASGENVFVTFNPSILREVQPGSSSPVSEQTYFTGRKSKVLRKFISPRSNATDSVLSAICEIYYELQDQDFTRKLIQSDPSADISITLTVIAVDKM